MCARGRAWERRSLLGRAGLVGSPAGRLVHGVCGGVPLVPGEGGHQAAATAGVAALPCLVLARLVKYGCCCPWPRGAPRGGQLALRGSVVVVKLLHRCCDGPQYGCSPVSRFRLYVVTSMLGLASMLEVLPLTRRVSRSRLLKGGATVNTTLCRTHELKSGDRRRPETERQGLTPRPSHDSRVASREFVTHRVRYTGTARPNPIIGTPGVVTCASSLRCELHSRLQSPQVTTEDCPKTLLRDSSIQRPG